jgi:hypothetical protein
MKRKFIQNLCFVLAMGLGIALPLTSSAGGNTGQMIAKFEPVKSNVPVEDLKPGDTVVKVCRACHRVTLVRVEKGGKGLYDLASKKCEDCGSEDTYLAISKQDIPFKEQIKR